MGAMIRILFPLIGYFCVATVITLAAGYGYLRSTGSLDDESMFRIVSLLHGIDLDEIAQENETDEQNVPPEEMSFEDRQQHLLMNVLHLQAKKDDIEKNITIFRAESNTLNNRISFLNNFSDEVKQFLEQRKAEATAAGLLAVRDQWKILNKTQSKQLLIRMVNNGQMDTVIDILNGLPPSIRKDIWKAFTTDEELQMLYEIEQQMLRGGPEASEIDKKLKELEQTDN